MICCLCRKPLRRTIHELRPTGKEETIQAKLRAGCLQEESTN